MLKMVITNLQRLFILSCIQFSFVLIPLHAQVNGIEFIDIDSWDSLITRATAEKKNIFIDVYATWCAPCKIMDAHVYTNKKLGAFIDSQFISIKFQFDGQERNADHSLRDTILKRFTITSIPTFIFLGANGELLHRATGGRDISGFTQLATHALTNPLRHLNELLDQYRNGRSDSAFLRSVIEIAMAENHPSIISELSGDYIKRLSHPYTKDNLDFIIKITNTQRDPGYAILTNIKLVNAVLGKNSGEDAIMQIAHRQDIAPQLSRANIDWANIERNISKHFGKLGEERLWGIMLLHYAEKNDWINYGKYYKLYFDRAIAYERSFLHMNNMSWTVFEHVDNPAVLKTAIKVMRYTLERFDSNRPESFDTYANLLYKKGRIKQALKAEQKALQLSGNAEEFVETLKKMESGTPTW